MPQSWLQEYKVVEWYHPEKPIRGVMIYVQLIEGSQVWTGRAITNEEGRATLMLPEPGKYKAQLSHPDYETIYYPRWLDPFTGPLEYWMKPYLVDIRKTFVLSSTDGRGLTHVTAKSSWFEAESGPDSNIIEVRYKRGQVGEYPVTFTRRLYKTRVELISFPEDDSLTEIYMEPMAPGELVSDLWKDKPMNERVAESVLVALSIIYGMKAIAGFTVQRFKPI